MYLGCKPVFFFLFIFIIISNALWGYDFTPSENGLYAVFETSEGEFTVKLNFDEVAMTVANFVGLAEGSITCLDAVDRNLYRKPYYDGLTFHRVINGFVIQSGSPNGLGTDGPGYSFPDEMNPQFTHDRAGIVSMANSGTNTNASQFFITLGAQPHLDGKHSVFGEVESGMDVVNGIGSVPVDSSKKPITPVVINKVTIVREGTAAQNFNANVWQIPVIDYHTLTIEPSDTSIDLVFDWDPFSEYKLDLSSDLQDWSLLYTVPYSVQTDPVARLRLNESFSQEEKVFFKLASITYPDVIDKTGAQLEVSITGGGSWVFEFDNINVCKMTVAGTSNIFQFVYRWLEVGNNVQLMLQEYDGISQQYIISLQIYLIYSDSSSGPSWIRFVQSQENYEATFSIP